MPAVPISEFEHRVAKWIAHMEKTREPLEVSQRGRTKMVAMDAATYEKWKKAWERIQALEIKLLVEAGERAVREGRYKTHEEVERQFGLARARGKRKR